MSFEFGNLYLRYERLWYDNEKGNFKDDVAEKRFYELRDKEIEIEKTHKQAPCPRLNYIINKSQIEAYADLERNFKKEAKHEQRQTGTTTQTSTIAKAGT